MTARLRRLHLKVAGLRDDGGDAAVEYGLMMALIAVVIFAVVRTVGSRLSDVFLTVANSL